MRDDRTDSVVGDAAGDDEDDAGIQSSPCDAVSGRSRTITGSSKPRPRPRPIGIDRQRARPPPGRPRGGRWRGRRAGTRRAGAPTARPTAGRGPRRRPVAPFGADGPGPSHLAGVAIGDDAGVEGDEVTGLHRPAGPVVRAAPAVVTRTTSWVAGVVTPRDAIASMNTPVSSRSLTPGRSSATAAAIAASATSTAARMASTSSAVLMRRAARRAGPPSTISALGNAIGSSWANSGDMASVPTRPGSAVGRDALEHRDEVHRVPRDPVQVVVGDLLGDALVPGAEQVDLAGRPHDHAAGAERARARVPQQRHARRVADVGHPPEHEQVEVVRLHRRERSLAAAVAERGVVRERLSRHRGRRGSR